MSARAPGAHDDESSRVPAMRWPLSSMGVRPCTHPRWEIDHARSVRHRHNAPKHAQTTNCMTRAPVECLIRAAVFPAGSFHLPSLPSLLHPVLRHSSVPGSLSLSSQPLAAHLTHSYYKYPNAHLHTVRLKFLCLEMLPSASRPCGAALPSSVQSKVKGSPQMNRGSWTLSRA